MRSSSHISGSLSRGAVVAIAAGVLAVLLPLSASSAEGRATPASPDAPSGRVVDVPAQMAANVRVDGHESLSGRDVSEIVAPDGLAVPDSSAMAARADSLLRVLSRAGRPFARVALSWSETQEGLSIDVDIAEGPETLLSAVDVTSADSTLGASARAVEASSLSPGGVLTPSVIERAIETLLTDLEEDGRPFAEVRVRDVARADDGGLVLGIEVDAGPETRFSRLAVSGNDVTRDRVVERDSGVVPGEPYRASVVGAVRGRIEKLGLFTSVSDPVVSVDPLTRLATVGVEVEEGPASRISGVLGYAPDVDGSDGLVTGVVDVELGNIAGTGREATTRWERVRRDYTRIVFSYHEPWLLGAPIDVGVEGEQTVNDTIYTVTEGDLLVTARMGDRTRVTWTIGGERYVPGVPDEETTTSVRTSMRASYDATDVPGNPTRGAVLAGAFVYAAKKGAEGERNRSGTALLDAALFLPVTSGQVLALSAAAQAIASTEEDVPFHEQLPLGGARSLRGYREEQFRGTRVGRASVEYRFILTRRSRAAAFVDAGYYYRGGSNPAKDVKLGYGIGLRGETRLGIIALDYGLGEGDGLLDGKLHVGLIREF